MILLQALTIRVSEDPSSTCALDQDGALDWTSKYVLGILCWMLSCTPCTRPPLSSRSHCEGACKTNSCCRMSFSLLSQPDGALLAAPAKTGLHD